MRVFLYILFIILNLQSFGKADEIRDFQIEGISVGDSLLDYYDENHIKEQINRFDQYPGSDIFVRGQFYKDLKEYDALIIHFKKRDKNYKIYQISGVLEYSKSINDCYEKMDSIDSEIKGVTSSLIKKSNNGIHRGDDSGKSTYQTYVYEFDNKDAIHIQCYDWSKNVNFVDHLRLSLTFNEFRKWIREKAYN